MINALIFRNWFSLVENCEERMDVPGTRKTNERDFETDA